MGFFASHEQTLPSHSSSAEAAAKDGVLANNDANHAQKHTFDLHGGYDPLYIGLLVVVAVYCGVFFRICMKKIPLPYTLLCLVFGLCMGEIGKTVGLGALGNSIEHWLGLDPHTIVFIFLPPLIFESAASMDFHVFYKSVFQSLILAVPGVMISAILTALVGFYIFPYGWNFSTSMALGSILAATDPVAVVALLKELGAPKTLGTVIEGESLLNDGVAFVLFLFFEKELQGESQTIGDFGQSFLFMALVGFFGGWILGRVMVKLMGYIFNDCVAEVVLSVAGAFGVFYIIEGVGASGVLGLVGLGLSFASSSAGNVSGAASEALEHVWESLGFLANTIVFMYSGIIMTHYIFHTKFITQVDFLYLFVLYAFLNIIRGLAILVLSPFLMCTGYGFDWKKGVLFTWGGLRGAVGLVLGLFLINNKLVDEATSVRIMFYVAGIAALTLFINGTTCGWLVKQLKLNQSSAGAHVLYSNTISRFNTHVDYTISKLRRNPFFKGANWSDVWQTIPILDNEMKVTVEKRIGGATSKFQLQKKDHYVKQIEKAYAKVNKDTSLTHKELICAARHRFLDLIQAFYCEEFEHFALESRPSFQILINAAKKAQDHPEQDMCEWKVLRTYIKSQKWKKYLCVGDAKQLVLQNQVSLGYEIGVEFMKAHTAVEHTFQEIIMNDVVSEFVLQDNYRQLKAAQEYLDDLNSDYSEITGAVKTKWAMHKVLQEVQVFANNLHKEGEINETELHNLTAGLKIGKGCKLKGDFSLLKPLENYDILFSNDLFENLTYQLAHSILSMCTLEEFVPSSLIASEGHLTRGVFFIISGRVKVYVSSEDNEQKTLQTLTCGDVFGDLEAVTRLPSKWSFECETSVRGYMLSSSSVNNLLQQEFGKQFQKNIYIHAGMTIIQSYYILETGQSLTAEEIHSMIDRAEIITSPKGRRITCDGGVGVLFTGDIRQVSHTFNGEERSVSDTVINETCKFLFSGTWEVGKDTYVLYIPHDVSWMCVASDGMQFLDSAKIDKDGDRVNTTYNDIYVNHYSPFQRSISRNRQSVRPSSIFSSKALEPHPFSLQSIASSYRPSSASRRLTTNSYRSSAQRPSWMGLSNAGISRVNLTAPRDYSRVQVSKESEVLNSSYGHSNAAWEDFISTPLGSPDATPSTLSSGKYTNSASPHTSGSNVSKIV